MDQVIARRTCRCVNHYCSHHQALRASLQPIVSTGKAKCWRCGEKLPPSSAWDLGHDDDDKTIYRGIECLKCNRSTSTRKAERERNQQAKRWTL
jgi:hypothetical protein